MSAAHRVTWEGGGEPGADALPVMSLEQLQDVRELLKRHDEASAQLSRHRDALRVWGGADVGGPALGWLLASELPPAVATGMAAWREASVQLRRLEQDLQDHGQEQLALTARLEALLGQQREQAALEARLQALEQLGPLADRLLVTRTRLSQLVTQRGERRGRGLAGLWGTLSGQAAALQREIDQVRHAEDEGWTTYRMKATSLGLIPVLDPDQVGFHLAQTRQARTELVQRSEAQRQELGKRQRALDVRVLDTQQRLSAVQARAAATWAEAQRLHGVPDWSIWDALWQRREEARVLWRVGEEAHRRWQEVTRALEGVWSGWPPDLRGAEALRWSLPQLEAVALAREAGARRREEEGRHRTGLLATLHGRLTMLVAGERARPAGAEQRDGPEGDQEVSRATATPPTASALPLPHRQTGAETGTLPAAARRGAVAPGSSPVLERGQLEVARLLLMRHATAAGQAAMCQEALEEWAGPNQGGPLLALLVSQPLPPSLVQALAEWDDLREAARTSLTGPEQEAHDRRVLRWETAWSELRRTLGVPAQPEDWHRLWASRAKAETLWTQWKQAQGRMMQLEGEMTPVWARWPLAQQNVAALRQALEAAAADTGPGAPPSGSAASRPAPSGPPPPAPGAGGVPAPRTSGAAPLSTSSAPRPPLPGQGDQPRFPGAAQPNRPMGHPPAPPLTASPTRTPLPRVPEPVPSSPGPATPDLVVDDQPDPLPPFASGAQASRPLQPTPPRPGQVAQPG
ncbi:hypothetical protein QOL99_16010, partial [Deinococcus sp. MIMF12]|nr:hypothetical protein [Deinococcus rhizophilus]